MKVLRFPAIAECDEEYRRASEALFEKLKPLEFLLERKRVQSQASWEAKYQQNPIVVGGGTFPLEKFVDAALLGSARHPARGSLLEQGRQHEQDSAFSSGVRMHQMLDGCFVIEHVVRGKWSALEREQQIKQWAVRDSEALDESWNYEIGIEQEPGSGGKESAENTIRNLCLPIR